MTPFPGHSHRDFLAHTAAVGAAALPTIVSSRPLGLADEANGLRSRLERNPWA
jgi:hypothetical protein